MCHKGHNVNVPLRCDNVDPLPRIAALIWMLQHIQKVALLYGGYNALKRDSPLLNELPVLFDAPVKGWVHTLIVALCAYFGNTSYNGVLYGNTKMAAIEHKHPPVVVLLALQ